MCGTSRRTSSVNSASLFVIMMIAPLIRWSWLTDSVQTQEYSTLPVARSEQWLTECYQWDRVLSVLSVRLSVISVISETKWYQWYQWDSDLDSWVKLKYTVEEISLKYRRKIIQYRSVGKEPKWKKIFWKSTQFMINVFSLKIVITADFNHIRDWIKVLLGVIPNGTWSYSLLSTRVSLKINGGMWLIVYDQVPFETTPFYSL